MQRVNCLWCSLPQLLIQVKEIDGKLFFSEVHSWVNCQRCCATSFLDQLHTKWELFHVKSTSKSWKGLDRWLACSDSEFTPIFTFVFIEKENDSSLYPVVLFIILTKVIRPIYRDTMNVEKLKLCSWWCVLYPLLCKSQTRLHGHQYLQA